MSEDTDGAVGRCVSGCTIALVTSLYITAICGVSLDDPTTSLLGPTLQFHMADGHVELHPDGLH